jgi:transposase
MPILLVPRAQRTKRLSEAQQRIGFATSASAGARLSGALAMAVSASTVLRLMHGSPLPQAMAPRAIGVDDWAWRKGRSWGTIIVDLERRRPIALLPDRSGAAFETWLRRHRGVEVITRDRSRDYARAAQVAAPGAMQVADRWHLLLNLRQMLERWLAGAHGRLRGLPAPAVSGLEAERDHPFPRSHAEQAATLDAQARQRMIHEEVRRRRAAGQSISAIAREMPLARATVRRHATTPSTLERGGRLAGPSILDPWTALLAHRLNKGCENGLQLTRELRTLGYEGSARQVHKWLQTRRTRVAPTTPRRSRGDGHAASSLLLSSQKARLPGPEALAWIMTMPEAKRTVAEATVLARVLQDEEAGSVHALSRRFAALVRESGIGRSDPSRDATARLSSLDAWLADAAASGIRAVQTFAVGIAADGRVVRAALAIPWSNAQAEGQISRLKLVKRQCYGRAGFELMRRRVLCAPSIHTT